MPFRKAFRLSMVTMMAAAGILATTTSPASASAHGREVVLPAHVNGCNISLYYNGLTGWGYAKVVTGGAFDKCHGFVHNSHKSKSWTPMTAGTAWSGGVWGGSGDKVQACVYAYFRGKYSGWTCTSWY